MTKLDADIYLVRAVRDGDETAWSQLIERYQGRLVSFARRMLAAPADAEDVVQETFIGLLRSLGNYDERRSLETYLFAILRNKLHDQFRKSKNRERTSLDALDAGAGEAFMDDSESPSHYVAGSESLETQRSVLVDAMRKWVENCRDQKRFQDLIVVEMLLVLGLRNKEVAADLDLAETAVAGVKFRVLEQWKKVTADAAIQHTWQEADLAKNSTVGRIWREEGISCLKRTTLGKYLLGALDDDWRSYIDFHVEAAQCGRCTANFDDLQSEDDADQQWRDHFKTRCLTSSVGFLSQT